MTSINCTQFRPHILRPDKCRNCFGDASKHKTDQATSEPRDQQQQLSNKTKLNPKAASDSASDGELTKEQLVLELERCKEEKGKLCAEMRVVEERLAGSEQLVESSKREIESLQQKLGDKSENGRGKGISEPDCKQCQSHLERIRQISEELEESKRSRLSAEKERDLAKSELKTLEREMDEMHDSFKEDESEQFEQIKQELDLAMKNCKILQIRLSKSERQYGQLEQVKTMLERQLEEANGAQQEAKESTSSSFSLVQLGQDCVRLAASEYDQLIRDLSDTLEREKDLQEQIKYSNEEVQLKSDRLLAVEAENEVLLGKVNRLTLANSRLRAAQSRCQSDCCAKKSIEREDSAAQRDDESSDQTLVSIQQNEQLKLALELSQRECDRLRAKLEETRGRLEAGELAQREGETAKRRMESELNRFKLATSTLPQAGDVGEQVSRLELECRQARTRLIQAERECRQLKAQLELSSNGRQSRNGDRSIWRSSQSKSEEKPPSDQAKLRELNRQLSEQCESLKKQNVEFERRIESLAADQNVGQTKMESDLLEKLKRQLDLSESELANTRSRLVELDREHAKVQRQHKRLLESLVGTDSTETEIARKVKLPPESLRETMSRQELRQALKSLEEEIEECFGLLKSKNNFIREHLSQSGQTAPGGNLFGEEQVKSLRRLLDQERLLSNNLKLDVGRLERTKAELQTNIRMLERERAAMEEEVDKLRQVNRELNLNLEETIGAQRATGGKLKDLQVANEKLRAELAQSKSANQIRVAVEEAAQRSGASGSQVTDLLLMSRDLSELKVKNGFLVRQLEIAREDTARQLEDLRQANEAQQRRAVEMGQLELKERHLVETQHLRDELNEMKQKLAIYQRQAARSEEETAGERDKLRSMERDWRREKGQWQQRVEQLEAQMTIERRSNEFKVKEAESLVRDKERELISVQDKHVQLERDFKRLQNKFNLLEENGESKIRSLSRDLEAKRRELSEMSAASQLREDEYYENCKRFNSEKATIVEALESLKRSYDEKLAELKSARELVALRQDQAHKERLCAQERIDELSNQLVKLGDQEIQAKSLKHQLQLQERQFEIVRRELMQAKEERLKLKTRCEDLERRCHQYEKQELISKTSSISASTNLFLKAKNPFVLSNSRQSANKRLEAETCDSTRTKQLRVQTEEAEADSRLDQCLVVEKLSSKISDQRHLINLLKQQLAELQLELKQAKLIHSSERSNWQCRLLEAKSRLNECEEKLLFEGSLLSRDTYESSRKRLEAKWAEERLSSLDMIQQLQAQNEVLARDLKKLSQSHDLLRLHAKQLEAHNNKLSKKLIEYQQQQQQLNPTAGGARNSANETERVGRDLEVCLRERRRLEGRQAELERANAKLEQILRLQAKPLIETVSKIVASLEVDQTERTQRQAAAGEQAKPNPSKTAANSVGQDRASSTQRPLVTSDRQLQASKQEADLREGQRESAGAGQQQQSRISRLLGKQFLAGKPAAETDETSNSSCKQAKGPKRVKVKSATLGITVSERRQLKVQLCELTGALSELEAARGQPHVGRDSEEEPEDRCAQPVRASSELAERSGPPANEEGRARRGLSHTPSRTSEPNNLSESGDGHVHWQLDSDLDSEKSWPGEGVRADFYRRFGPSARSRLGGGSGASLTDCESESSLASECSTYSMGSSIPHRFVSGAESDGCVQAQSSQHKLKSGASRKRGLKTRLTSTLRNISRSITGLTSDSESDLTSAGRSKERKPPARCEQKANDDAEDGTRERLREIRV